MWLQILCPAFGCGSAYFLSQEVPLLLSRKMAQAPIDLASMLPTADEVEHPPATQSIFEGRAAALFGVRKGVHVLFDGTGVLSS